ncbi:MAG: PEP-CTERM sorting domain-containing protein [Phenylobacterium sp.]|uniref:PEPxxWA-CTERM sorting domain-containing protein n=1 Tax=Phenylobacterium sp. TaxID=1871053 RepID=UPI0011F73964|nr:PEPxxWA-CTERM sorting domain-containing protein [Phenylobacterium sp.]TAJ69604.1 MAG: PEP-CTERM sorting domain-containing protein [Phenylobacterium sp.]
MSMRHIGCFAGVRTTRARFGAFALAVLAGGSALAGPARAACVEQMSRMPIAAAPAAAPAYRANMMRRGFAAAPAAAPARARALKVKASGGVRKRRPTGKAAVHGAARKARPALRRVAAMAPVAAPALRRPTPMPVAARDLATPLSYALIATTVCEAGPPAAAPVVVALAAPVGPFDLPSDSFIPGTGTETLLPPIVGPGFPGLDGPPAGGPGTEPPIVAPPVFEPPPGVPAPAPEPGTWALLIVGFGLIGARLRRPRARPLRNQAGRPA